MVQIMEMMQNGVGNCIVRMEIIPVGRVFNIS